MSNQIFRIINFYQNQLLIKFNDIHMAMVPLLQELTSYKISIFNKLLELIGNKDDIYYE